ADALLILTEWEEFAALDLDRLRTLVKYPIVLDGRNLYDPAVMMEHGFSYYSVGRPATLAAELPKAFAQKKERARNPIPSQECATMNERERACDPRTRDARG
ncbi:MAG: UDP binding domain-containing protein, partial [Terriglobales bacterium]